MIIRRFAVIAAVVCVLGGLAAAAAQGPVSYYGKLQASGNKLIGSKTGEPVQIKGVSLGWSNSTWETSRFFNTSTVNAMVDLWKAEVIRAPLGIGSNGYYVPATQSSAQAQANLDRVKTAINAAIAKDVYIIIDWHSHTAHSAAETAIARTFFSEIAREYGHYDHVIFEIYNEPDVTSLTWSDLRNYTNQILPAIREHSDNLVLVPTLRWCQRIDHIPDPISDPNVAYVLHFYAHSHPLTARVVDATGIPGETATTRPTFRQAVEATLGRNLAIFVSEWGTTHADGGNGNNFNTHNVASTDAWMAFLDEHKISSAAWNLNNKNEGSAFFRAPANGGNPGTTNAAVAAWTEAQLTNTDAMTASGAYIYNMLNRYAETAEWRNPSNSAKPHKSAARANTGLEMAVKRGAVTFTAAQGGAISEVSIYNIAGKRVFSQRGSASSALVKWSTAATPRGMYVAAVKLNTGAVVQTNILVK